MADKANQGAFLNEGQGEQPPDLKRLSSRYDERISNPFTQDARFLATAARTLDDLFARYDVDGNFKLDEEELQSAFKELLLPCTRKDISLLLAGRNCESLTKAEFVRFCALLELRLLEVYNRMDTNGNGYISLTEFRKGMLEIGWPLGEKEANDLFEELMSKHGDIQPLMAKMPPTGSNEKDDEHQLDYSQWRHLIVMSTEDRPAWVDIFHEGG